MIEFKSIFKFTQVMQISTTSDKIENLETDGIVLSLYSDDYFAKTVERLLGN